MGLHRLQQQWGALLRPFSFLYGAILGVRRRLIRPYTPPCFCASVGNISLGGTGKTPVTDLLLTWAEEQGLRPVVLTRGYGGHPPHTPFTVTPHSPPAHAGDEALMLARRHPDARILVDPKRVRAARAALAPGETGNAPPDLFLLDDGFQHIAMGRHLDLVLLDEDDMEDGAASSWNITLPAGTWREPATALAAADAFLVKTDPVSWPLLREALAKRMAPYARPVFPFTLEGIGLRRLPSSTLLPASCLPGPYALLCGVGKPEGVRRSAEAFVGRPPARVFELPDHHDFARDSALLQTLNSLASLGMPLVCTAKDAVKLPTDNPFAHNTLVLEVAPRFLEGDFMAWWERAFSNYRQRADSTVPSPTKAMS